MKTYLPVRFRDQAQGLGRPRNLTQYRETFDLMYFLRFRNAM